MPVNGKISSILMKFSALPRIAGCLAGALFIAGAWIFHITAAAHNKADDDCRICVIVVSPELNSDCGSELLSKPAAFSPFKLRFLRIGSTQSVFADFYGRAPPLT